MKEAIYSIALSMMPKLGAARAKCLLDFAGSASFIFEHPEVLVEKELVSSSFLTHLQDSNILMMAEEELDRALQLKITPIPYTSPKYPYRLKECIDAPTILYYKGTADLNASRVISIVGTRRITDYGRSMCNLIIKDLKSIDPKILILSGLAHGVDVQAHRAALNEGLDTVGVLAHGLDVIYPSANRSTAQEMLSQGGVLTEYKLDTFPDKRNFVARNRVIAGMADATIVIESAVKGGSLITADLANSYDRECFAVPGRCLDEYSVGCNQLIKNNKAILIESGYDVVEAMQWSGASRKKSRRSKETVTDKYKDLSGIELDIVNLLKDKSSQQVDDLLQEVNIPISELHTLLFTMEMNGYIEAKAGGVYQLA